MFKDPREGECLVFLGKYRNQVSQDRKGRARENEGWSRGRLQRALQAE